jgi:hypothetical protein
MLRQFLVGTAVSMGNIVIHALMMTLVVQAAQTTALRLRWPARVLLPTVMIATVSVLMVAHALEVFVWSLAYAILGAVPAKADFIYFAFVNYTTLGYGDIIPVARWQLLGPMTAMNGILLFGWSTAVIFEVLRKTLLLGPHPVEPPIQNSLLHAPKA